MFALHGGVGSLKSGKFRPTFRSTNCIEILARSVFSMRASRSSFTRTSQRVLFLLSAGLILAGTSFAVTENVLYNFNNRQPDGGTPGGSLVADSAGNLYGTTTAGGSASCSCGTVFELSPPATAGGS